MEKCAGKSFMTRRIGTDWKYAYATKLCEDKIAERAQHAILSTLKFPENAKQLDVREGVILANPARVWPLLKSCASISCRLMPCAAAITSVKRKQARYTPI